MGNHAEREAQSAAVCPGRRDWVPGFSWVGIAGKARRRPHHSRPDGGWKAFGASQPHVRACADAESISQPHGRTSELTRAVDRTGLQFTASLVQVWSSSARAQETGEFRKQSEMAEPQFGIRYEGL